jgi:hypothetical protein
VTPPSDRRAHTFNDSEAVLRQVLLELGDLGASRQEQHAYPASALPRTDHQQANAGMQDAR